ncbi:MAG: hypothetical protein KDD44_14250 [Bdellovibrionales bacterium]|nr:hypothetical protein [Bdellovibrionales bacterium]
MNIKPLETRPLPNEPKAKRARKQSDTEQSFEDNLEAVFGVDRVEIVRNDEEEKQPRQDARKEQKTEASADSEAAEKSLNITA